MLSEGMAGRLFVDHDPTASELELIRLSLSTFQDGSGMVKDGLRTLPGWRDFERVVGELVKGAPTEDKSVFDVLVQSLSQPGRFVGLSCKTRGELSRIARDGRVTIELSNASREMWNGLREAGINQTNYKTRPKEVGASLVNLVRKWHRLAATYKGSKVDTRHSSYLVLLWRKRSKKDMPRYQIYRYRLELPGPGKLKWYFTKAEKGHLNGDDAAGGRVFEWYGESGGQLKYYPLASQADWKSSVFALEPIPEGMGSSIGIKAAAYFPELWQRAAKGV